MRLVILPLLCILPAYATETFAQKDYCHSSVKHWNDTACKLQYSCSCVPRHWNSITNGHTKRLYNKNWLSAGMTGEDFEVIESDRKLLFISSDIKSSFFDAGGLAPDTIMRLISIYKDYGVDFKKDIVPKSKLEVLCESDQKAEEKILYTSLTTSNKAISLYYYESQNSKEEYFNKEGVSLKSSEIFVSPLNGDFRISSNFGNRKHPIHGKIAFHKGVDYAAKLGTPIHATAEGVIEYIGKNGGYGNYIKIKHNNKYSTCYAHISKFSSDIKLGSKVKQGQIIAYVGSTGVATGPHLHYEVIYNGKHIDPLTIAHGNEIKLPDRELREFKLFVSKVDEIISREGASEKAI
ncbi:M23 family metallopeptidase [Wolbachia endosymbiont of Anopheles demeilloni]|uniref:M23 family metallopeptidase n=1 Tax=Wolbachia endosymbiont of Anopheles demeilloni TaxID=2748871 RepID=UPI001BD9B917|nr:M23 family metallopeptidase [Wolbachia endosymbiont of Anopheles demeilloni]UIP92653.1 M23 family metallopeptidase [Wolbachia endosymbiont of Anopheles demeilloni]